MPFSLQCLPAPACSSKSLLSSMLPLKDIYGGSRLAKIINILQLWDQQVTSMARLCRANFTSECQAAMTRALSGTPTQQFTVERLEAMLFNQVHIPLSHSLMCPLPHLISSALESWAPCFAERDAVHGQQKCHFPGCIFKFTRARLSKFIRLFGRRMQAAYCKMADRAGNSWSCTGPQMWDAAHLLALSLSLWH